MKKLRLFDKLVFLANTLFALMLLLSMIIPYIPPQRFPVVAVLSLVISPLLFINVIFLIYWILRVKKQVFLSVVVLLLCFVQFNSFYRFDFSQTVEEKKNQLSVMSYNVRIFNVNGWTEDDHVQENIEKLIAQDDPDIIAFQEYHSLREVSLDKYPYSNIVLQTKTFGHAIYSKYPIINKGSLDFENSGNNAIYADIVTPSDTIRVYNLHLESLQINPNDVDFRQEESQRRLLRSLATSFRIQQDQIEKVVAHQEKSPYKIITMADLNNTAFSYVYRKLKNNKNDAFAEAGKGLGKTFAFKSIPIRIDFILTDKAFIVSDFKTFTEEYSDHFPIRASLTWD